jgi:hypothetical protein
LVNQSKAKAAEALAAAGIQRRSFSIAQFCARHDISEGFYRKMRERGLGPLETRILDRIIISENSETEWLRERETASRQPTVFATNPATS